jgi:uncharacterized membrane protein
VQNLLQLSKGEIFDNTGDWREARAQIMVQEAGFKVISLYIYRKIWPTWMQTTEWNKRRVEMRGGRMLVTDLRVGVPYLIGETR